MQLFLIYYEHVSFCRENTIGVLQTLLLDLLSKRAGMLLQPVDTEVSFQSPHHIIWPFDLSVTCYG